MQVEINLDDSCTEPKIVIYTASMSEDVQTIVHTLTDSPLQILFGKQGEKIQPLIQADLIRVYAAGGKVFAVTDSGEYTLRQRLYELENRLPPKPVCPHIQFGNYQLKEGRSFRSELCRNNLCETVRRLHNLCVPAIRFQTQKAIGTMR